MTRAPRAAGSENRRYVTYAHDSRARLPEMGAGVDAIDGVVELSDTEGCERALASAWSLSDEVDLEDQAVRFR